MRRTVRIVLKATVVVVLLLLLTLAIAWIRSVPAPLPAGSESAARRAPGAHAVGKVDLEWVDPSRPTAANGDFAGAPERRFAVTLWFPQADAAAHPLLVYSHGFMSNRHGGKYLAEHLASRGYVVVAADFPHFDQNPPAPPVLDADVPHTTLPTDDPEYAAAERGRYLAATACLNCHTDQITPDVPDLTKAFAGGKKYTFIRGAPEQTSVNLTPDPTGLADWTVADIETALLTNLEKDTNREFCNTHPGGPDRLGGMTDSDRHDIAVYLHTLPPIANGPFQCEP